MPWDQSFHSSASSSPPAGQAAAVTCSGAGWQLYQTSCDALLLLFGECQRLQWDICAQFARWTLQHKPSLRLSARSQWSATGKSHAYIWNSATVMPMGSQGAILHKQHSWGKETGRCSEVVTEWHLRDQSLTWAQDSYSKCHHTGRSIFKHVAVLPRILLFQHTSWASQDQTYQWQLQLIS